MTKTVLVGGSLGNLWTHDSPLARLLLLGPTLDRFGPPTGSVLAQRLEELRAASDPHGAGDHLRRMLDAEREAARRVRELDDSHRAELESAWRGEVPADPMPRELPASDEARLELELAERRFRIAHFVRFERELNTWARWLSMRETAFASTLCAMTLASAKPMVREQAFEQYEARANRARAWTNQEARAKSIRRALYASLEAHRHDLNDDATNTIATSWALDAPELGRVDLLRVVGGVSLPRVLEAWRTTAEGKRNRGVSVYGMLSVFFRRVAGLEAVHDTTIENESREVRSRWRKPKRAMPRNGGKKKGKR